MTKKIAVSVSNDVATDQRVERVCRTLNSLGFSVVLFGRLLPNSVDVDRSYEVKRKRLRFNSGPLFYLILNFEIYRFLKREKPDYVLANDLDTLLANYTYYKWNKSCKRIIYDSHEYFTEVPELTGRFAKRIWQFIEKRIFPKLEIVYTVSPEIAEIYMEQYNVDVGLIRNLPLLDAETERTKSLQGDSILIYQGAVNVSRGIELMVETMVYLDSYRLYIFGSGDVQDKIAALILEKGVSDRVFCMGKVSPENLRFLTKQASLGLSFEEDVCLNYRYALPNKIFDYIHADLPILISDLPSMRRIVDEYEVGEVLISRSPNEVANQIKNICDGNSKRSKYIANCTDAKEVLCWEEESKKLEKIFKPLL